jgi:hypothetical protein
MWDFLEAKSAPNFSPALSILRAYTALIKTTSCDNKIFRMGPARYNDIPLITRVKDALVYAGDIEAADDAGCTSAAFVLLDHIEVSLQVMDGKGEDPVFPAKFTQHGARLFFRESILKARLVKYLSSKLDKCEDYFHDFEKTPLSMVLQSELFADKVTLPWTSQCIEMVRCLLEFGEDPNEAYEKHIDGQVPWATTRSRIKGDSLKLSAWTMLMSWVIIDENGSKGQKFNPTLCSELWKVFLMKGADPNALVHSHGGSSCRGYSSAWRCILLASFNLGSELDEVRYLQALDTFIEFGAKSDISACRYLRGRRCRTHHETVLEEFFRLLTTKPQAASKHYELRLLTAVTDRLLSNCPQSGAKMGIYWPAIESALPIQFQARLRKYLDFERNQWPEATITEVSIAGLGNYETGGESRGRKRQRETDTGDSKRLRFVAPHEQGNLNNRIL